MIGIGLLVVLSVVVLAGMFAFVHKARTPLTRKEYAIRALFVLPVALVWAMTDLVVVVYPGFTFTGTAPLILVGCIFFFLCVCHWTAQRLLDVGVLKWWAVAMNVIPFVGLLAVVVLCFVRSRPPKPTVEAG